MGISETMPAGRIMQVFADVRSSAGEEDVYFGFESEAKDGGAPRLGRMDATCRERNRKNVFRAQGA